MVPGSSEFGDAVGRSLEGARGGHAGASSEPGQRPEKAVHCLAFMWHPGGLDTEDPDAHS